MPKRVPFEQEFMIQTPDGVQHWNIWLNMDIFRSEDPISQEYLESQLNGIELNGHRHEHMVLDCYWTEPNPDGTGEDTYFVLRDYTPQELETMSIHADIDYLKMIGGLGL